MKILRLPSLQTRILTAVVISMGLSFMTFTWYNLVTISKRFDQLEQRDVSREVDRLLATITDQIRNYEIMITDWGHWDDSVNFITDRNEEFIKANLYPDVIKPITIDSIRYFNLKGEIVYAVDRDVEKGKVKLSDALNAITREYNVLKDSEDRKPISHLARHGPWIVITTVLGVRPNSGDGPHVGYIMFSKVLSEEFETALQKLAKMDLDMQLITEKTYTPEAIEIPYPKAQELSTIPYSLSDESNVHKPEYRIWEIGEHQFHVMLGLRDARNEVVVLVHFPINRSARLEGSLILKQLSLTVAFSFLVLLVILVSILQIYFLNRLKGLDSQLNNLNGSNLNGLRVAVDGDDEIGRLGLTINSLLGVIETKNRNISDIISTVKSGFLITDREGRIRPGVSNYCYQILGETNIEGQYLYNVLLIDKRDKDSFKALYEQVIENPIDPDFSLDQLPKVFRVGKKIIRMVGQPLANSQGIEAIVFTLTDVTHEVAVEEENLRNRSLIKIFTIRQAFLAFLHNSRELLNECYEHVYTNPSRVRKNLHTLKGNFSVYGMTKAVEIAHAIESKAVIETADIFTVDQAIQEFLREIQTVLNINFNESGGKLLQVEREAVQAFRQSARSWADVDCAREEAEAFSRYLMSVSIHELMKPVFEDGQRIAQLMNKKVEFELQGGDLRVDPYETQRLFQDLIHILRNALDHGIEHAHNRGSKHPVGRIRFEFTIESEALRIRVEDDGRGIDFERVREKAVEAHILSPENAVLANNSELTAILFFDGFSTTSSPTHISGRGIGMSAIHDTIKKRNGTINISSIRGQGTTVEICVPLNQLQGPTAFLRSISKSNLRRSS